MSRKRSQPPISLFSFQDIITSVTAIMIVIVICLTLELLERDEASAVSVSSIAAQDLRAAVISLQSRLAELQSQTRGDTSMLAEAAAVTPNQVTSQIQELERQLEDAQSVLNQEQARSEKLGQESARVDALRFNASAEIVELEQLQDRLRRAEVRLQDLMELKRPIFTMPRGSDRDGWLVVVNSNSIEAARIGVREPPIVFHESRGSLGFKSSAAASYLKWVDASRSHQRYFMIIVRPGGDEEFETVKGGLDSRRIPYGFDVIGFGEPLLDSVVGAGPP